MNDEVPIKLILAQNANSLIYRLVKLLPQTDIVIEIKEILDITYPMLTVLEIGEDYLVEVDEFLEKIKEQIREYYGQKVKNRVIPD